MSRLAANFMTEDTFWSIIENSNEGNDLERELFKLSEDEIFGYCYWWNYFHRKSYNQALWAVAYVVLGGCSDDSFDYFRFWLVTKGKDVFMKALDNPDSLCDFFDTLSDSDFPEWEEVSYVPSEVFEEKFSKDFFDAEDDIDYGDLSFPDIEFEWNEDDESSIRKVCPNTFDKWWGNDVF